VDTAGLRDSTDAIEAEGVRRARAEAARADLVLYVVDATAGLDAPERAAMPAETATVIVWNKTDLPQAQLAPASCEGAPVIALSARTGDGLPALCERLKRVAGFQGAEAGVFTARRRHLDALARAQSLFSLAEARLGERSAFELVAEELRLAQRALGEITGEMTSDELIGSIFRQFCIGK
jgi:tRNA modification GTPase